MMPRWLGASIVGFILFGPFLVVFWLVWAFFYMLWFIIYWAAGLTWAAYHTIKDTARQAPPFP